MCFACVLNQVERKCTTIISTQYLQLTQKPTSGSPICSCLTLIMIDELSLHESKASAKSPGSMIRLPSPLADQF